MRQGYLLCACVAALVVLGCVRRGYVSKARAELVAVQESAASSQQQLATKKSIELELAWLNTKKQIDDELGSRISMGDIIAELSRLLSTSMSITELSFEAVEIPVAVQPADGGDQSSGRARSADKGKGKVRTVNRVLVVINGLARSDVDVANFIAQVSACPLFENVNMGYTRPVVFREQEAREFQARCYVVR